MILNQAALDGIAAGKVTRAFRRWRRPTVRAGGTLRTAVGVLAIDAVTRVALKDISDEDARAAGYEDATAVTSDLAKRKDGAFYRIDFHLAGEDPRVALRTRARWTAEEIADVRDQLARWDRASASGPWTQICLELISRCPATRAATLAAQLGFETKRFKANVRKLKELGLTESLEIGYRLSPRGNAFLRVES